MSFSFNIRQGSRFLSFTIFRLFTVYVFYYTHIQETPLEVKLVIFVLLLFIPLLRV